MSAVRKLCCLLWALSFSVFGVYAEDNVLWWMFDETTSIDDVNGGAAVTIGDLVGRGDAAGKTVNAIRIAAYSGDSLLGYLAMPLDGDLDDNTFYNMPSLEGTSEPYAETWNAGPAYAELGTYATTPGTSFVIELGNWDYEDTNPDTQWTVLAVSEPGTVDSLEKFIHDSNYDMQSKLEWTGGHYSVPEPTSGLLVLVGGALLALRRRRSPASEAGMVSQLSHKRGNFKTSVLRSRGTRDPTNFARFGRDARPCASALAGFCNCLRKKSL